MQLGELRVRDLVLRELRLPLPFALLCALDTQNLNRCDPRDFRKLGMLQRVQYNQGPRRRAVYFEVVPRDRMWLDEEFSGSFPRLICDHITHLSSMES